MSARLRILAICVGFLWSFAMAEAQACGPGWCNTFPVQGAAVGRLTPPFGSSAWNKLNYVPDVDRFFIYTSDGIYTFSNSWWSYGVLGHAATSNPWIEESTSGTLESTVTDNSKGFLKSAIDPADTTITLHAGEASGFHPDPKYGGILVVDDEEIGYAATNVSKDTFTGVRRGIRGTTPASHSAGTLVNAGAPDPRSRIEGSMIPVNDHISDRHPFLSSAYDSRRHQLFQAGGIIEINKKSDTWYLCVTPNDFCPTETVRVWKRLLTRTPAPDGADSAMTYDFDDDVMILYGGQAVGNPTAETWLLCFSPDPQASGNKVGCPPGRTYPDWVKVSTIGSPGPRFAHSIVYDSHHRVAVLFGGTDGTARDPNETWTYVPANRTWTNAKPSGQNPVSFRRPAMTYDSTRHQVVLYEGPPGKVGDQAPGGLYLYDAGTNKWERSAVRGGPIPSGGVAHGRLSLDYDPQSDTFVVTELAVPYGLQTWELRGSALGNHEPSPPSQK